MKKIFSPQILLFLVAVVLTACNKDKTIEAPLKPVITLDSENGIYKAKIGRPFTISPSVANGEGAEYLWLSGTQELGNGPTLTHTVNEVGEFYITFRVKTDGGQAEKELKVDVGELAPPVISIAVPPGGLRVLAGETYTIEPDVQNSEDAEFAWYEGTELKGSGRAYSFMKESPGAYEITLKATNEDGAAEKTIAVEVVEEIPITITFLPPLYGDSATSKSAFCGQALYLMPIVANVADPVYSWSIGGEGEVAQTPGYMFRKETAGEYEVTFTVTGKVVSADAELGRNISRSGERSASVTLNVTVYGTEEDGIRPPVGSSKKHFDKVYEYVPAPGQFINDPYSDFDGESTMEAAAAYAQRRMENNLKGNGAEYVSLGGFGGYIVVGFDHSIPNKGGFSGYDFSIVGNQFEGDSEPGIVWVMQDVNGNGKPDDQWYELKGSEYGAAETIYDYAVTYYKPGGPGMDVRWTDNRGGSGTVDYLKGFHRQDYYYPAWISADSYTLYGTRLKDKTYKEPGGSNWVNGNFGWGYADNWGSDRLSSAGNSDAEPNKVYFKISNAIHANGTPADLKYVDFIKVQTGVNAKADVIGETSTEVLGFFDENMQ